MECPAGQDRKVTVRFYADQPGEGPTFTVIDDVVYRKSDDQEGIKLLLEIQDLWAQFCPMVSPEARKLAYQIRRLEEEEGNHNERKLVERLKLNLPQHAEVIDYCYCDELFPMKDDDLNRHTHCSVPASWEPA